MAMLVSHVITRLIVGGAQENTVSSVIGLQSHREFETRLITGPTEGIEGTLVPEFDRWPGVLEFSPDLVRPVSPGRDFKALFHLTKIFRESRPTIVHTHSGKAGIVGRWAARRAGVPIIIHTIHGPSFGPWQGGGANFVFKNAERAAGRVTTHFISVANAMTRQYLEAGIGQPADYTRVFSGFHLQPFLEAKNNLQLRSELGIGADEIVAGKIARFVPLKGHDDLFEVAPALVRKNPKLKFLLIGGGPLEEEYRKKAKELGIEKHFVFAGLLPPARIPALTGIMDFLIHLSTREGLPRALPQAFAAGKPVVAYDCDGASEVCIEGETGFLAKPRDFSTLEDRIGRMSRDKELRMRLGETGRDRVRENFPVEKMVEEIARVYHRLLAARGMSADVAR